MSSPTRDAGDGGKRKSEISPPPVKRKAVKMTVQSTTTSATVANFFKPASAKEPEKTTWRTLEKSLLVGRYRCGGGKGKEKDGKAKAEAEVKSVRELTTPRRVAAFDLDSTLILTSSGNVHAKSATDWKWWDPCVPGKLRELQSQGYLITIFTNQGGLNLEKPNTKLDNFKPKVASILANLDIPLTVYAATTNDHYRKPRIGMWDELSEEYDLDVHGVDKEESFLVGDAAGRDGDHSASDRYFANNLGIKFFTPEEFFWGKQARQMRDSFDPVAIIEDSKTAVVQEFTKTSPVEIVVLVGSPGSGKSSFAWRTLVPLGYERVNQDILKTKEKCVKVASGFLEEGKAVVVDNTNADTDTRKAWVDLGKKFGVPVRCVWFTTPAKVCEHNAAVRAFGGDVVNPENRKSLPKIAFTGYNSRFKEPTLAEGFQELLKMDFRWVGTEQEREVWGKQWV